MNDENPTNDKIVADITDSLHNNPDADSLLIDILANHIVKINPANNAVADAANLIEKLARERGEHRE